MADDAVAAQAPFAQLVGGAFADHAEPVGVVDVQERVVLAGDARELLHVGRVPGHRVHPVDRDHAWGGLRRLDELLEVLGVVVPEALDRRAVPAGDARAVVDRLVRPAVQEQHAAADQDRDHRHVDVGDRREQQRVLGPEQRGRGLLELFVQHGASEQPGPGRVAAPLREVLGDRVEDLLIEVQAQVVARGEVREPVVADPDPASLLLVDDRVEHRVRRLQPREVLHGGHPALQPAVALAAERLVPHGSGHQDVALPSPDRFGSGAAEIGRVVVLGRGHRPVGIGPSAGTLDTVGRRPFARRVRRGGPTGAGRAGPARRRRSRPRGAG